MSFNSYVVFVHDMRAMLNYVSVNSLQLLYQSNEAKIPSLKKPLLLFLWLCTNTRRRIIFLGKPLQKSITPSQRHTLHQLPVQRRDPLPDSATIRTLDPQDVTADHRGLSSRRAGLPSDRFPQRCQEADMIEFIWLGTRIASARIPTEAQTIATYEKTS